MHSCLAASRKLYPLAHWGDCSVRGRCPFWTCLSAQSCVVPVVSVGESCMFGLVVYLSSSQVFFSFALPAVCPPSEQPELDGCPVAQGTCG